PRNPEPRNPEPGTPGDQGTRDSNPGNSEPGTSEQGTDLEQRTGTPAPEPRTTFQVPRTEVASSIPPFPRQLLRHPRPDGHVADGAVRARTDAADARGRAARGGVQLRERPLLPRQAGVCAAVCRAAR